MASTLETIASSAAKEERGHRLASTVMSVAAREKRRVPCIGVLHLVPEKHRLVIVVGATDI
jgi:hypothetical protein